LSKSHNEKFYDDMLKGNASKDLVKLLLEKSGYIVYAFGYESTFSGIRKKLGERGTQNSITVRRIKSSPDLLVYDEKSKDAMLVEVKMRSAPTETGVLIYGQKIEQYKEFWNDSILVLVVPCADIFYAQRVNELETKEKYDATIDFRKLEEIFTRINSDDLAHFRARAIQNMRK
jgi:hypothetical protein